MAKKVEKIEPEIKWEISHEHEDCHTIWKYVKRGGKTSIYEVEVKYKKITRKR